jgi:dTDP-L-rhamnose 4-epimerase
VATSIYAATKRMQEEMCLIFGNAYRLPVIALRYFNIYGPRQSLSNPYTGVAAIFLSRLMNGHSPVFFEDGRQSRDFVHVSDVAAANLLALDSRIELPSIFNVGTGTACTIADVAHTLARGLNVETAAVTNQEYRAGDIRHCFADVSRIAADLGFRARVSLDEGFRDLISWSKTQLANDRLDDSMSELKSRNLVR